MTSSITINQDKIQQWITGDFEIQKIEKELTTLGYDTENIEAYISEYKKAKHNKRVNTAFTYLISGAILGFISCLFAIFNPVPSIYLLMLYGGTFVSAAIILIGLYFLLE